MAQAGRNSGSLQQVRRWLLWIFVLGLIGTATELLLLEHYEDPWQFVPLVLIALAAAVLLWSTLWRDQTSLRIFKLLMVLFVVAGFLGLALHFRGAAEFQLETDPTLGKWQLIKKVMRVKAPPVLAPGVMLQLGLIGLVYAFSECKERRSELT